MGNAIKFTGNGEVVIQVSEECRDAISVTMCFQIMDTGIGIAPEVQAQLFQAFTQADGSTTREYGGTGLGLAICKRLVKLMEGEIGIDSKLGGGSLFWFTIKLKQSIAPISWKPRRTEKLANIKVLVVDDNATNGRVLHYQLSALNMPDEYASSAAMALQMLRTAEAAGMPYRLAILDMQMPVMDGLELARIMQSDPTLLQTRKIILTSLGLRLESRIMEEAGISACLLKPAKEARLVECLLRVMSETFISLENVNRSAQVAISPLSPSSHNHPLRILVAEDNRVNQKVVLAQLRKLGYEADTAINGIEALKASEQTRYDVILMDCQMPEMGGCDASRKIREREAESNGNSTLPIHIIALTANAMEGDREKCLAAGMDDYLSKPTRVDDLDEALGRFRKLESTASPSPLKDETPSLPLP